MEAAGSLTTTSTGWSSAEHALSVKVVIGTLMFEARGPSAEVVANLERFYHAAQAMVAQASMGTVLAAASGQQQ